MLKIRCLILKSRVMLSKFYLGLPTSFLIASGGLCRAALIPQPENVQSLRVTD